MKRIIDNLFSLAWIGVLIKKGQLTPTQGRFLSGAIYTFEIGLGTYLRTSLESMDFSNWKITVLALCLGFIKTMIEGITKFIREKGKIDKETFVDDIISTKTNEPVLD